MTPPLLRQSGDISNQGSRLALVEIITLVHFHWFLILGAKPSQKPQEQNTHNSCHGRVLSEGDEDLKASVRKSVTVDVINN